MTRWMCNPVLELTRSVCTSCIPSLGKEWDFCIKWHILYSIETHCQTALQKRTFGKFLTLSLCWGSCTQIQWMHCPFAQVTPHSHKTDQTPSIPKRPPGGRREGTKASYSSAWAGSLNDQAVQGMVQAALGMQKLDLRRTAWPCR